MKQPEINGEFLLTRARIQLIFDHPFFGALAMKLILINAATVNLAEEILTMATDGIHLFYNEDFVMRFAAPQDQFYLQTLVAHEVHHCIFGHPWRFIGVPQDMRRLLATDYSINPSLRDAGLKFPPDKMFRGVWPNEPPFNLPEGKSAEWYWKHLPEPLEIPIGCGAGSGCGGVMNLPGKAKGGEGEEDEDGKGKGSGEGGQDGQDEWAIGTEASPDDVSSAQSDWDIATSQAAQSAKRAGKLPAQFERLIDEAKKPKPDVENVLRRFLKSASKDDYRMTPPNKRYFMMGLGLVPSVHSERLGTVVFGIDSSGSITPPELNFFLAKVNNVLEELKPEKAIVITCDAAVHSVAEFEPDEYPITVKEARKRGIGKGGGGTDFIPVFRKVRELKIDPVCLVYLTDMYGSGWPDSTLVDYPVLWAATSDVVAPIGETVKVEMEL